MHTSNESFTFVFNDGTRTITINLPVDNWIDALTGFKTLVSAAYGYSIDGHISLVGKHLNTSPVLPWTGPVFDGEEWL